MSKLTEDQFDTPAKTTSVRQSLDITTGLLKHSRIALTGAQRTGKTTLARAYANKVGVPFVDASVSKILASFGLDSSKDHSAQFGRRLVAQRKLLESLDSLWDNTIGGLITDRSPLCFAMYTLADITASSHLTNAEYKELISFINDCKSVTLKHFNTLVRIPYNPRLPLVEKAGSAPANPAHIHHLEVILADLQNTLYRRNDAAVEERGSLSHVHPLRSLLQGEALQPEMEKALEISHLSGHVLNNLVDSGNKSNLSSMVLPRTALAIEDRVNWLVEHQQYKTLSWVQERLTVLSNSPLVMSKFEELGQAIPKGRLSPDLAGMSQFTEV